MSPDALHASSAQPATKPLVSHLPRISTATLMRGGKEIVIQHGVEEYRLRITASGKLILTK